MTRVLAILALLVAVGCGGPHVVPAAAPTPAAHVHLVIQ